MCSYGRLCAFPTPTPKLSAAIVLRRTPRVLPAATDASGAVVVVSCQQLVGSIQSLVVSEYLLLAAVAAVAASIVVDVDCDVEASSSQLANRFSTS